MNKFDISGYLFVYGLLHPRFANPYSKLVTETSTFLDDGFTNGCLYEINGHPGLTLSKNANNKVFGSVWKINRPAILTKLDRFEGIGEGFEEPYEYRREIIPVQMKSRKLHCWAYLYNWTVRDEQLIPSGNYLDYIKK